MKKEVKHNLKRWILAYWYPDQQGNGYEGHRYITAKTQKIAVNLYLEQVLNIPESDISSLKFYKKEQEEDVWIVEYYSPRAKMINCDFIKIYQPQ